MGRVLFIGAGPGAADLITLRGARLLGTADVVLFDALTDPALHELAPDALWLDVGKRGFERSTGQATINALLVKQAQLHEIVVRLKGGDPSVFGRLEEEMLALADAGIACEIVPGVSAVLAAAAASRRPLTRRGLGRSLTIATAMSRDGPVEPSRSHQRADTEVFYMAGTQLAALGRRLIASGWDASTLACVVSRAGWPDERCSDHRIGELAHAALLHTGRPAVVTIGAGAAAVTTRPTTPSDPVALASPHSATPHTKP